MTPPPAAAPFAFVYLASQSPRRRQLLEQIGVRHELLLPGPEEDAEALEAVLPGEAPRDYVARVTGLKLDAAVARLAARGLAPAPVLCADTTVALDGRIYGKPDDAAHAARMLSELAGRTHEVLTAVAVAWPEQAPTAAGWCTEHRVSVSAVRFAALSPEQIARYVASGEPMGKAGAYAVQGRAGVFIEHIAGSYTGIMGLPLHETGCLLRLV
ncbi:MAG: Maf family protein [Comamonas sp.]